MIRRFREKFDLVELVRTTDDLGGAVITPVVIDSWMCLSIPPEDETTEADATGVESVTRVILLTRSDLPRDWLKRGLELRQGDDRFRIIRRRDQKRVRLITTNLIQDN